MIQLYTHTFIIFEVIFHYRLLEDSDYSSLCYTVNKQVTFELHSSASSSVRPVSEQMVPKVQPKKPAPSP